MKINYYIDDDGMLYIYDGNALIVEISECENLTEEEILDIIKDEIRDSIYINNTYSEEEITNWLNL